MNPDVPSPDGDKPVEIGAGAYLRDDPLRLHRATSRMLYVSRCLDRALRRAPRGAVTAPTTLILATRDRIIDNPTAADLVDHLTDGAADTVELPGAHTLDLEADPRGFYDALRRALERAESEGPPSTGGPAHA